MFNLLVLLGVVGSQFFMISNPTRGDELWVFNWLLLVALSSFVFRPNRVVDVKWFGVVTLVAITSVFANNAAVQRPIYFGLFLHIFVASLAIKTIAERMTFAPRKIGLILIRIWLVMYGVLILQSLGIVWKDYELSGFYTMPWMMGSAAVLSIPFIRKMKSWYGCILILPIVMSHSSSIAAVALVMWIQPKLRWKYILLVVLAVFAYVFLFDRGLDTARFAVIKNSFPYWHNHIFGDGIGSWAHKAFVRYNGADLYYWRWAHNELYQMTTETGILGGLSVLALISNLFRRISTEQKYYMFGIVVLSMFHPIFHIPRLIPFLILIFAMFVRRNSVEC